MVLKFNNDKISFQLKSIAKVHEDYPSLVNQAEKFKQLEILSLGEKNALYVGQGECAVIAGDSELPILVGSDDATTCHIVIFIHSTTKTCAVAHLDGRKGQDESLHCILQQFEQLDGYISVIDVYVVGGYSSCNSSKDFIDDNNSSEEISIKLLRFMTSSDRTFNIKLWCSCELNTKKNSFKPVLTGLALNRKSIEVYPANFTVRCPATVLRSAFFWAEGSANLVNIYDPLLQAVVVRPFHEWETEKYAYFSTLSDSRLLTYFSTSPLVEPPSFCVRLRETFSLLGSTSSIFDKGCKKYFKLNKEGHWEEIYPKNNPI